MSCHISNLIGKCILVIHRYFTDGIPPLAQKRTSKLLLSSLLILVYAHAQEFTTMAVLDFEAFGISPVESAILTNRMRSGLVMTGKVTVVERGMMQQILTEQDFQLVGCTSDECAVEVGRLLGVANMVAGSIGRIGATYAMDFRIIDVESGAIARTVTQDFQGTIDGMLKEIEKLAQVLVLETETGAEAVKADVSPTATLPAQPGEVTEPGDESPEPTVEYIPRDEPLEPPEMEYILHDEPPKTVGGYAALLQNIEYPESAIAEGIEGEVFVQAFVDETGKVTKTRIGRGFPRAGFNEAAIDAVLRTQFMPAEFKGEPVGVWLVIRVKLEPPSPQLSEQPVSDDESSEPDESPEHPEEIQFEYWNLDAQPKPVGGYAAILQNIEYPDSARVEGIEGTVLVQAFVDQTGKVTKTRILRGFTGGGLNEAAIATVLKTRFAPARYQGKPVGIWVTIPVPFKLQGESK